MASISGILLGCSQGLKDINGRNLTLISLYGTVSTSNDDENSSSTPGILHLAGENLQLQNCQPGSTLIIANSVSSRIVGNSFSIWEIADPNNLEAVYGELDSGVMFRHKAEFIDLKEKLLNWRKNNVDSNTVSYRGIITKIENSKGGAYLVDKKITLLTFRSKMLGYSDDLQLSLGDDISIYDVHQAQYRGNKYLIQCGKSTIFNHSTARCVQNRSDIKIEYAFGSDKGDRNPNVDCGHHCGLSVDSWRDQCARMTASELLRLFNDYCRISDWIGQQKKDVPTKSWNEVLGCSPLCHEDHLMAAVMRKTVPISPAEASQPNWKKDDIEEDDIFSISSEDDFKDDPFTGDHLLKEFLEHDSNCPFVEGDILNDDGRSSSLTKVRSLASKEKIINLVSGCKEFPQRPLLIIFDNQDNAILETVLQKHQQMTDKIQHHLEKCVIQPNNLVMLGSLKWKPESSTSSYVHNSLGTGRRYCIKGVNTPTYHLDLFGDSRKNTDAGLPVILPISLRSSFQRICHGIKKDELLIEVSALLVTPQLMRTSSEENPSSIKDSEVGLTFTILDYRVIEDDCHVKHELNPRDLNSRSRSCDGFNKLSSNDIEKDEIKLVQNKGFSCWIISISSFRQKQQFLNNPTALRTNKQNDCDENNQDCWFLMQLKVDRIRSGIIKRKDTDDSCADLAEVINFGLADQLQQSHLADEGDIIFVIVRELNISLTVYPRLFPGLSRIHFYTENPFQVDLKSENSDLLKQLREDFSSSPLSQILTLRTNTKFTVDNDLMKVQMKKEIPLKGVSSNVKHAIDDVVKSLLPQAGEITDVTGVILSFSYIEDNDGKSDFDKRTIRLEVLLIEPDNGLDCSTSSVLTRGLDEFRESQEWIIQIFLQSATAQAADLLCFDNLKDSWIVPVYRFHSVKGVISKHSGQLYLKSTLLTTVQIISFFLCPDGVRADSMTCPLTTLSSSFDRQLNNSLSLIVSIEDVLKMDISVSCSFCGSTASRGSCSYVGCTSSAAFAFHYKAVLLVTDGTMMALLVCSSPETVLPLLGGKRLGYDKVEIEAELAQSGGLQYRRCFQSKTRYPCDSAKSNIIQERVDSLLNSMGYFHIRARRFNTFSQSKSSDSVLVYGSQSLPGNGADIDQNQRSNLSEAGIAPGNGNASLLSKSRLDSVPANQSESYDLPLEKTNRKADENIFMANRNEDDNVFLANESGFFTTNNTDSKVSEPNRSTDTKLKLFCTSLKLLSGLEAATMFEKALDKNL